MLFEKLSWFLVFSCTVSYCITFPRQHNSEQNISRIVFIIQDIWKALDALACLISESGENPSICFFFLLTIMVSFRLMPKMMKVSLLDPGTMSMPMVSPHQPGQEVLTFCWNTRVQRIRSGMVSAGFLLVFLIHVSKKNE